jgi:DNA sulfur modification protein DndB
MSDFEASAAQSDSKNKLNSLIEPYIIENYRKARCYPGLIFQQGTRKMIQINVPADEVPILLEPKPSDAMKNDPHSGKNRPLVKGHAEEIKDYVVDRARAGKPWILGTLTANVAEDKIEIVDFDKGMCLVIIPYGVSLDITDGQHRTKAIDLLRTGPDRKFITADYFPITLVLESSFQQCQTDFRDMAQTEALPKSLLVSFGAMGRDGITQELVERVSLFQGKTQKIKASPGSNNKFIYTSNYIAKAVSCAFSGNPNDELLSREVGEHAEVLVNTLNHFFSECSETQHLSRTSVEDLTVEEITTFKQNCLLGMSVGLEILGRLLHTAYNEEDNIFDEEMILDLTRLIWSRESPLWQSNVVRVDEKAKDHSKRLKISANASAVRSAVEVAKAKLHWA